MRKKLIRNLIGPLPIQFFLQKFITKKNCITDEIVLSDELILFGKIIYTDNVYKFST